MKRLIAVIITFIILLSAFSVYADNQDKSVPELLKEAEQLLYRSQSVRESEEKALGVLDQIIKLDPYCKQAYDYKADALYNLGRGNEAVLVYDEALKVMPGDDELIFRKSNFLMRLKRYDEAIVCFDKLLQSQNEDFKRMNSGMVMEGKATALFELKRYSEAIVCYDKLIANSGFYYNLDYGIKKGTALMELKKYSDASKWFNEVKKHVVPYEYEQYAKAYYASACAYSMLGKTSEALADLRLTVKYDKTYKAKAKSEKYLKSIIDKKEFNEILYFDENLLKKLNLGSGFYVIDHLKYDINGDKYAEDVALVGRENINGMNNVDQVTLVIVNRRTGKYTKITPKHTEGSIYANRRDYLLPKDLNGDGVKDVTVQIGSSSSQGGWAYSSHSFKGNKPILLDSGI